MEQSQYQPMTPSSQGPNPLRPYYRPPSIGNTSAADYTSNATSSAATKQSSSLGSSARSILSDLNYGEILGDSRGVAGTGQSLRGLLDQALWKYSSVFMAQPFEVAKMTLQVRAAGSANVGGVEKKQNTRRVEQYEAEQQDFDDEDDEDDDEPSYFTSTTPQGSYRAAANSSSRARARTPTNKPPPPAKPPSPLYKLDLRRPDSLIEVISQLWQREGAWGIWKGTNVTFLYSLVLRTVETWTRSMLAAVLNLPDPGMMAGGTSGLGGLDIIDSPSPLASLSIAVVAAGIAGLVLAPLDIVRTRVMITSVTVSPRSLIPCIKQLPSWSCPPSLVAPTLLYNTIPTFLSTSTPLFLRSTLRIDPIITPATYSVCTFLSSTAELFIKLPIETVLRRGQIGYVSTAARTQPRNSGKGSKPSPTDTESDRSGIGAVVELGPYSGVASTMWRVAREEGDSLEKTGASTKGAPGSHAHQPAYSSRKGQGVQGLWRGWRVGWWGLVGVWGAAALGGMGGKGGEF